MARTLTNANSILTLAVAVGTSAALLTPRARREDRDE